MQIGNIWRLKAKYQLEKSYQNQFRIVPLLILLFGLLLMHGCTTDALEGTGNKPSSQIVKNEAGENSAAESGTTVQTEGANKAKVIREKSTVSRKGTNIRVLVNQQPITNYDIQRRAAFLRLRRVGGNRTTKATEELIEDRLKLQEARKNNLLANDALVNASYADFAKRNRMSLSNLNNVMARSGVTSKHFKEFLRGQISWQRVIGTQFRAKTQKISQGDAIFKLRQSGGAKPTIREFRLQQVIFVIPTSKRNNLLRIRKAEANSFRQRFTNCGETISFAKQLKDVSVKELGRVLEPELPPTWKDLVIETEDGKTTRVQTTPKGVEFLAVCSVRNVNDDRAAQVATQSEEFNSFNKTGGELSKKLLGELRSKATIVYR